MITRKMIVSEIVQENDRTLLYASDKDYHVIASKDVKVCVGDEISYEPYGSNFGWYIKETVWFTGMGTV